jgi:hypothetical protein
MPTPKAAPRPVGTTITAVTPSSAIPEHTGNTASFG